MLLKSRALTHSTSFLRTIFEKRRSIKNRRSGRDRVLTANESENDYLEILRTDVGVSADNK